MRYDLGEGGEQVRDVKDEDILYQLQAIAMADVTKLINVRDGTVEVSQTQQLPKKLRCAIAAIEKSAGGIKVKFYDKLKALELLGKYKGLFSGGSNAPGEDSPLLEAILRSAEEVTDDAVQEIEQQATAGDDMVEQTESS